MVDERKVGIFTLVIDSEGKLSYVASIPLEQVFLLVQQLMLRQAREEGRKEKGEVK